MNTKGIEATALSIRSLSMDAIQKANSGHPGLPLGAAEVAAVLYGEVMKHNPANSKWADRDRFVLSAGHGSMLLYSILHLAGYKISMDDIKSFRQLGSKCPGHPEAGITDGVEATSGPLGQGIAAAVGMAVAETMLAARFNTEKHTIVDHYTYALVGEGCLEEGVSSEACSLAGNLKLGKLIVFYDENKISIDGNTEITFTDDIEKRYLSYGWQVLKGSMYNPGEIEDLVKIAKSEHEKPTIIILKSVIGKGAPKAGTADVHGAPLGADGVKEAKRNLGLPEDKEFYVVPECTAYFEEKRKEFAAAEEAWNKEFADWKAENPELAEKWNAYWNELPTGNAAEPSYNVGDKLATRDASGKSLNYFCDRYEWLVGGSADLQGPNKTKVKNDDGTYNAKNRKGRTIEYGIREFAMSQVQSGINLHGGLRAFGATFLVFSDYLRPSLRVAALSKIPNIYIFTHDSIYVGEDGPTHQPVETYAALRAIPNSQFLRPGDAQEAQVAWEMALASKDHPVSMAFTRQALAVYEKADADWKNTVKAHGAYVVLEGGSNPDITVLATGSEVNMALDAAKLVSGKKIRVVSVMDKNLFDKDEDFVQKVTGGAKRVVVAEAGISQGWEGYAKKADLYTLNTFGESAPAAKVAEHFGFTPEKFAEFLNR
ncbi:MAG: transketolase [Treponema sp.]|nr:transketolase [Treponema sp.]